MEGCEKSLCTSEIRDEKTISKSKPLIALLLVEANISELVKLLHPLHQLTLNDFKVCFYSPLTLLDEG